MQIPETIRKFLIQELPSKSTLEKLDETAALLESGILDSLGIMKLLSFIETTYSVSLSDSDITPENFENISAITSLIQKRL